MFSVHPFRPPRSPLIMFVTLAFLLFAISTPTMSLRHTPTLQQLTTLTSLAFPCPFLCLLRILISFLWCWLFLPFCSSGHHLSTQFFFYSLSRVSLRSLFLQWCLLFGFASCLSFIAVSACVVWFCLHERMHTVSLFSHIFHLLELSLILVYPTYAPLAIVHLITSCSL